MRATAVDLPACPSPDRCILSAAFPSAARRLLYFEREHSMSRRYFVVFAAAVFSLAAFPNALFARADIIGLSSSTQYSRVIYGYTVPVYAQVYNDAAPSSGTTLFYSISATFPYGNSTITSGPAYSSRAPDGGASYDQWAFNFNTSYVPNYGTNTVNFTATNTVTNYSVSQGLPITVLARARPAFYMSGQSNTLSSTPIDTGIQAPNLPPQSFGGTGGGESASFASPVTLGDPDPNTPTDDMDIDSLSASGDPEITDNLPSDDNIPPDDPADGDPSMITIDTSTPGLYNTLFEVNYSDEQDLPGADAPGSEHAYFLVTALVTDTEWEAWITLPEPTSASLLLATVPLLLQRRRASNA
jgi:hypothetical protein